MYRRQKSHVSASVVGQQRNRDDDQHRDDYADGHPLEELLHGAPGFYADAFDMEREERAPEEPRVRSSDASATD